MRIFITGVTGFVGGHLLPRLLERGYEVTVLVRNPEGFSIPAGSHFHIHKGDITDDESIISALHPETDVVFHLAADTAMWRNHHARQYAINVTGTENMVKAAMEKRVKRFVHTSSISAFGVMEGQIDETTPGNAMTCGVNYCKTKYLAEQAVLAAVKNGLNAIILNPAHIIGPGDVRNWIQLFRLIDTDKLPGVPPGGGNYCHVNDIVIAHLAAIHSGKTGERYLLGGEEASFIEVVNKVCKLMNKKPFEKTLPRPLLMMLAHLKDGASRLTGKEPDITPEKVRLIAVDMRCKSGKAKKDLNYSWTPLDETLRDTYEWYINSSGG